MQEFGFKGKNASVASLGLKELGSVYWNLSPEELIEHTIDQEEGVLADSGAIVIKTGEFTGRSPKDRFIVKDSVTENTVDWNDINVAFDSDKFDALHQKMLAFMEGKNIYVRDVFACADEDNRLNIRVATQKPWSNMFASNMFLRPTKQQIDEMTPEWQILCVPTFMADPAIDGTRQHNFAVVNFAKKMILIGGTGYTGEIKKGIFSVLNYVLPQDKGVLSMHCSSNIGENGDTAVFFGLSGTGKTTLSADPKRGLIGDDEHGWTNEGVFNFEGGCYAKCIDLSAEKEPQIYGAIKHGAILENIKFYEGTRTVDFEDTSITQNTRVSYPLHHIDNAVTPSKGGIPKNIFFLTYDAFGVLPPISKLTKGQAMYQFISGYTSKVAGTEAGITEPVTAFSACYGAPFLPLHPTKYAEMLGQKIDNHNVNVWLVNTGMTGGAYGEGTRMSLKYTRALITAALEGKLDHVEFENLPIFNLSIPKECPNVPSNILNPKNTWENKKTYDKSSKNLANEFVKNFKQFISEANEEIKNAAPELVSVV